VRYGDSCGNAQSPCERSSIRWESCISQPSLYLTCVLKTTVFCYSLQLCRLAVRRCRRLGKSILSNGRHGGSIVWSDSRCILKLDAPNRLTCFDATLNKPCGHARSRVHNQKSQPVSDLQRCFRDFFACRASFDCRCPAVI
jgi:hypothetical protein